MKNPICRLCNHEISDSPNEYVRGYWAPDPNTPDCPGNEVMLIGHGWCVDQLKRKNPTLVTKVIIHPEAEANFLARLNAKLAQAGLGGTISGN